MNRNPDDSHNNSKSLDLHQNGNAVHSKRHTFSSVFDDYKTISARSQSSLIRVPSSDWLVRLCLWDLEVDIVLKEMEGHRASVYGVAVSEDG